MNTKSLDIATSALKLSRELKEVGHDLFVAYKSHTNACYLDFFRGGWMVSNFPRLSKIIYSDSFEGEPAEIYKQFVIDIYECIKKEEVKSEIQS